MQRSELVSGYLLKWTNILKGYQKRWFLLQGSLLSYYRNPEAVGRRCRGTFDLKNARLFAPSSQTSFILTELSGRKHHLKALSPEDKNTWLQALSEVINISHCNTDVESDSYSEDSFSPSNHHVRTASSNSRIRPFRQLPSRSKLDSRPVSSPNLRIRKNDKSPLSTMGTPPLTVNSAGAAFKSPTDAHISEVESRNPTSKRTFNIDLTDPDHYSGVRRLRRASTSKELSALLDLLASVESFRMRLERHTSDLSAHLATVESLLSTTEATNILHTLNQRAPDQQGNSVEPQQTARNLQGALSDHRRYVKEFHETCTEALLYLVTNIERWHRKILTEQERCVGLERTVEQLARQHRALELQLSHCYASLDDSGLEAARSSHNETLRQDTADFGVRRRSVYYEPNDSTDEEQFFDAYSSEDVQDRKIIPDQKEFSMKGPLKLSNLSRTKGLRASAMSLNSLKNADESSYSDSSSDDQQLLKTPFHDATQSVSVASESEFPSEVLGEFPYKVTPATMRKRRTAIPHSPKIALNLWSIIKSAIGKDITRLPLPVNFNEPISFLQRASEDLTYSELLDEATSSADPADQMALIAAFAVSCYASTAVRTSKPFNPLLGETFELDRSKDTYGWRLIAEQVSHHPPESALHCESVRCGWKLWFEFVLVSKFRGKYMSILPKGTVNLLLPDGSRYTWCKATTVVHNLIVGTLWIDNYGDVLIRNHQNNYQCPVRLIAHSYFSRGPQKLVTGVVQSSSGTPLRLLQGCWDSHMESQTVRSDGTPVGEPRVLWRASPLPLDADKMYNFSLFTIELNEIEPGVAPTDSRLRPDQRLMEKGAWDEANEEKRRLEQKQRSKRFLWEERIASGVNPSEPLFTPLWFSPTLDPVTGEQSHVYLDNYWQAKDKQGWSKCPDIF